ncbi:hypothetical protein OZZ18_00140 [[Ruminococcus] gnavus]|uniref:hypothetical protein n=1 Tax=Mediterraneibacter gnavus TaxID=33038 RepID=UPI00228664B0|nr:hypothetical protein [Mediterraneibacter gnavus]MCZ0645323.1 hypothetical protein [Mediterraneibacter gnavus]
MRNKKLWKNLMLVTTLTVALGTVSATALAEDDVTLAGGTQVTAFASEGDIDGGIAVEAQAEQTAPEAATTDAEATTPEATVPEADTTDAEAIVPEEVAPEATAPEVEQAEQTAPESIVPEEVAPEATAPEAEAIPETDTVADATNVTINVSSGAVTFDGSSDIVLTYTITADGDFMVSNDGPMLGESMAYPLYEKVSETEHRFTITKDTLKRLIDMGMEDDMSVVFNPNYCVITGEDTLHYFPKVTLTYDAGNDNGGDNGNGETPEKPENPDPENPDNGGDNGNGETPEKPENPDPENPDNGNGDGETPENPDNGGDNGDNQKPENPDNGNGDNQNPDGDNSETPDDNKDVQDWMTLTPAQKVTPQTQTVSTTQTAPKTGDAASTLPLLGTGLTSLGVALGAIFKKRR